MNTTDDTTHLMLVSLTDSTSSSSDTTTSPSRVGGKGASLAKLYSIKGLSKYVPKSFALTVDFFQPWINEMKLSNNFKLLLTALLGNNNDDDERNVAADAATLLCKKLQEESYDLTLSKEQTVVIQKLVNEMNNSDSWNAPNLAAVRSSAPEEDGTEHSFAGIFDTCLGIAANFDALEKAIRDCFASLWDYRVLHYKQMNATNGGASSTTSSSSTDNTNNTNIIGGFAVVVMEMIDSQIAGVAFSANPLNSDRDEMVVDSVSFLCFVLVCLVHACMPVMVGSFAFCSVRKPSRNSFSSSHPLSLSLSLTHTHTLECNPVLPNNTNNRTNSSHGD
jgi:phosphoenolpyruvate synthase/pyruvate phosphate dikinase